MKKNKMFLFFLLLCLCSLPLWAAGKHFSFYCLHKIIRGDHVYYENRQKTYFFEIQVILDHEGICREDFQRGHPFIHVRPGQRYSVRIYNPLPVRVAVNLMIDGLNSINGSPSSPSGGSKWLLEPYSSVTIKGWQVNQQTMRRFYFTSIEDSYAAWQSHRLDKDLTVKCGVISAAYFWNKRELENYFLRHPIYEGPLPSPFTPDYYKKGEKLPAPFQTERGKWLPQEDRRAGTGMGEKDSFPVESVDFHYDMGMYRERDMVKIYYDFGYPKPWYPPYREYKPYRPDQDFAPEKP